MAPTCSSRILEPVVGDQEDQSLLLEDAIADQPQVASRSATYVPLCLLAASGCALSACIGTVAASLRWHSTVQAADTQDLMQKWGMAWAKPEGMIALGNGSAVHGRGLVKHRWGLCLYTDGGLGAPVFMGECDAGALSQQWQYDAHLGHVKHEFAGCLDGGGNSLHMWTCNSRNPAQRWIYHPEVGEFRNKEKETCLHAGLPKRRGSTVQLRKCVRRSVHQHWSVGVRMGQVQVQPGACLWAQAGAAGERVGTRTCARHADEDWLYDASLGRLQHQNSNLCAEANHGGHVLLRPCRTGTEASEQRWRHNLKSGEMVSSHGLCLGHSAARLEGSSGEGRAVAAQHCKGSTQGQRWSTGILTGQVRHRHGVCLHTSRGARLGADAARVVLWACEDSFEQWSYDDGLGHVKNLDGLCLEGGHEVSARSCRADSPKEQLWTFDKASGRISQGTRCLEAARPSVHGTGVELVVCTAGQWAQEWDLSRREKTTPILTVETRLQDKVMAMPGVPGRSMQNVGSGKTWEGFRTKVLTYLPAVQARAKQEPGELVMLMDADVGFGGCSEEELLERYHRVVEHSGGASVVVSADVNQYPPIRDGIHRFHQFEDRRASVMKSAGLEVDAFRPYFVKNMVTDYAFVNSGFVMGPAEDLAVVLECMLNAGWDHECRKHPTCHIGNFSRREVAGANEECCFDDQRALTSCALEHPKKIAIDYTGSLMLTTYGLQNMLEVRRQRIHNEATGTTQCFIHANGQDGNQPMKWDAWLSDLGTNFLGAVV